ncbi:MAG TPA: phosphosulfolactate synthase [Actinomycetota bacterium]|nr:phosphosulfolactate synthase [Actinomycetota bacterium]
MIPTSLRLPDRPGKPRRIGLTMVIDNGAPVGMLRDYLDSAGELIDFVKLGWGTSLVSRKLPEKLAALAAAGIPWFFGGTLFEKFLSQGGFDDFRAFCIEQGARYVEVSNGTLDLPNGEKARYVDKLAADFVVISEVGFKDAARSEAMELEDWVREINRDIDAGATLVVTEARESGRSGICRSDGMLRRELIEGILDSGIEPQSLLFEAPTKDLQTWFISRLGPNVNLGNIALGDIIALETLRLGLRSDTLLAWD